MSVPKNETACWKWQGTQEKLKQEDQIGLQKIGTIFKNVEADDEMFEGDEIHKSASGLHENAWQNKNVRPRNRYRTTDMHEHI